ncbi:hypothetical protein JCM13664_17640 [Methylothermus subterraneus]
MNLKKLTAALGLSMGLTVAGPANSLQLWSFQDDDIDFLYRPGTGLINPNTCSGTACDIQQNDVLISVFTFNTFTKTPVDPLGNPIGPAQNGIPSGKEVTGIAAIQLNSDPASNSWNFVPYSGGLNAILALGDGPDPTVPQGNAGEGAIAALFINNGDPSDVVGDGNDTGEDRDLILDRSKLAGATNCSSLADCIDEASKGTLLQVDGFLGDPDEFWTATILVSGARNIKTALGLNNNLPIVSVAFGLSTIYNAVEPVILHNILTGRPSLLCTGGADGCVNLTGNSNVTGGQGLNDNGAFAHSTTINMQKYVPEPATLALFGAGLLGLGLRRRLA